MNDLEQGQESRSNDTKMTKKSNRHCSSCSSSAKYELYEIKVSFGAPTGHTLLNYVLQYFP